METEIVLKQDLELDFGCDIDSAHVSGHFQHFLKFDIFDQKI